MSGLLPQEWSGEMPTRRPRARRDGSTMPSILALVQRQVVPRLIARVQAAPVTAVRQPADGAQTVSRLVDRLLEDDPRPAAALFAELRESGASSELLCLGVLTGAARRLGELWEVDSASFTEVTIGTLRLQGFLHEIAPELVEQADLAAAGSSLLLPAPGEQHGFGLQMLTEFFRRGGWQVRTPSDASRQDPSRQLRAEPVDLVGFSISSDLHIETLTGQIAAIRRVSRNRGIIVMVGGPLLIARPELTRALGADATARDADEAVRFAGSLLRARQDGTRPRKQAVAAARRRNPASVPQPPEQSSPMNETVAAADTPGRAEAEAGRIRRERRS